jgi:hypothetical protein
MEGPWPGQRVERQPTYRTKSVVLASDTNMINDTLNDLTAVGARRVLVRRHWSSRHAQDCGIWASQWRTTARRTLASAGCYPIRFPTLPEETKLLYYPSSSDGYGGATRICQGEGSGPVRLWLLVMGKVCLMCVLWRAVFPRLQVQGDLSTVNRKLASTS